MYSKKPKQICSLTWVQYIVVRTGIEPVYSDLKGRALPLSHLTMLNL